jgi:cytochrome P450
MDAVSPPAAGCPVVTSYSPHERRPIGEWAGGVLRPAAGGRAGGAEHLRRRTERRAQPGDDLISQATGFEIDGRPVTDDAVTSYCFFMFMAGLDTVAAAFGYALYHFATHPADRERIVADPALIPAAVEEILRVYAFTIPARKVRKDIEVAGCPIAAGSMVQLPIRAATRDATAFPGGADVQIDRSPNNHIAFGAGPHRCLGSHLARHELVIALEEWHKRIPGYRLADAAVIVEVGRSSGPDSVPPRWDR